MKPFVRWRSLWEALGARGNPSTVYAQLEARYGEPGRFYHNLDHVMACLAELDAVRALCYRPEGMELALWFHDAIYDPRGHDSEERSARLLRETARGMGIDAGLARAAGELVLATEHLAERSAPMGDLALIRDIDLAILGQPAPAFASYEDAVRREYAFLYEEQWRAGRSQVIKALLGRPHIYATDGFRARYEERARENLRTSLARLA